MLLPAKRSALALVALAAFFSFVGTVHAQSGSSSTTTMMPESASGSCVDVSGGSSQVGLGIDQWTCTAGSNQNFIFTENSSGYYTIQAQNDNLCLDAGSGSVTTGVQIVQNTCSGTVTQEWEVNRNSDGSYSIVTTNGAGCFDVYAGRTANGTTVTTYACHGSNNESFTMSGFKAGQASKGLSGTSTSTMMPESASGSCVDVPGGSSQVGLGIDQWTCTGTSNQNFVFTGLSNGYYTIQAQNDNLCLDAGSGSVTTGVQIVQSTCSGTVTQEWEVNRNSDGSYSIVTTNGAGCFDVYAGRTANGTTVTTYACHGSNNESFVMSGFQPASSTGGGSAQTATPTISPSAGTYTAPLTVTITPTVAGTPIYYTTNGTTPTTSSTLYAAPFTLSSTATVKAIAVASGSAASSAGSVSYTVQGQTATPTISPSAGTYTAPLTVTITPAVAGTPIYYTTNGAIPTTNSTLYSAPFTLNSSAMVEAIAIASGSAASSAGSVSYTVQGQTATPTISPSAGTYTAPLTVTITPAVAGTPIYYTTNGTTPTTSSTLYAAPFTLSSTATVKAIAVAGGSAPSSAGSVSYTVQGQTATPTISPSAGTYTAPLTVTITPAVAGTPIYYTTNGAIPTTNSTLYSAPFTLNSSAMVEAIAIASGSAASSAASVSYTVQGQTATPTISPSAGTYTAPLTVTITPAVAGTPIYYTTNGATPTTSSTLYAAPFTLTSTATVKAIAVASGSAASSAASVSYTVQGHTGGPVIFNVSSNAQPGDVISIQGTNFGTNSQVWLGGTGGSSSTQLTVVNQVGTQWIAAQTPSSWTGAMVLWVSNTSGISNSVNLNGAIPLNLDALQLVPGGAFKVLGRNLLVPGYTPVITINGQTAPINLSASNANMLVATAPASISSTSSVVITVDNGNGTGPAQLNRPITIVAGSGDPFGLGAGWAAGFTFYGRTILVNTPCNGSQDDSGNIQSAINLASNGGGVVQLPSGTCVLANSLSMASDVVLQGMGQNSTVLEYDSNYPISAQNADLVGLRNFTLVNANSTVEGLIWKGNTRSFFQNINVQSGFSHQLYLTGNQNFIVTGSTFIQGGSVGEQNPYLFNDNAGFVFSNNTSVSVDGSPTFQSIHDALIINNHFTRNAVNQNEAVVIFTHQFVMDFAYRFAIIGNTFDITNGPITNTLRNDGETLMTEGGGGDRTENEGTVGSATSDTLTDPNNAINVNPFGTGLPENYGVAIVSGTGAGQNREVIAYANNTMTVDEPWDVIPDSTSQYATFVWGLEKTLIEGNTLVGNPRGIWIYQSATRDVDISNNTITNGGGIYLRSEEQSANGVNQFDPMYNVRIEGNNISNNDGVWMSYIDSLFVIKDTTNFGTADTGVEIRNNSLTANSPNVTTNTEDRVTQEGFMTLMYSEASAGQLTNVPVLLGTIFQSDQCLNCDPAFVIGTGDYGTVLAGNLPLTSSPDFLADWQTLGSSVAASIDTVIQGSSYSSQTITVTSPSPSSAVYNSSFQVAATATSQLPVSIAVSGACSGSGSGAATITMSSGTGTCDIFFNAGNGVNYAYAAAPLVTEATAAQLAIPVVTFTGAPVSATGGKIFNVTATTNASDLPTITASGACSVGAVNGTPAAAIATATLSTTAGTCSLSAVWATDGNYSAASATQSTTDMGGAQVATPMFTLPSGVYTGTQSVAITDSAAGATIYYTTNGTVPSTGSPQYTSPITVSSSESLSAIAVAAGYSSAVATSAYVISSTSSNSSVPTSYSATNMDMFVGPGTGNASVTGTQNIAIGVNAGASLTSPAGGGAQDDTFIGFNAGYSCATCRESIFIGDYAGYTATGNGQGTEDGLNTMIGSFAGYLDNGINEVFIGQKAGVAMSGSSASNSNNTFIGTHAGSCWSSGIQNVFIGRVADSGSTNCSGNGNTFVGYNAAEAAEVGVANNTCIGSIACFSLTTSVDTMIGHNAGWQTTTGQNNTFIGDQAGASNITGGNNTEVGESACYNAAGSNNICVGYNSNPHAAGDNNEIVIGEGATGQGSNSVTIGNPSSTKLFLYGITNAASGNYVCYNAGVIEYDASTCTLSLEKYKHQILPLTGSLAEIMRLRPVQYQYKPGLNLGNQIHVGLIAEEVQRVDPRLAAYKNDGELESVDYEHLTAVLTKAVQEQQAEIAILKREVKQLQKKRYIAASRKRLTDVARNLTDKVNLASPPVDNKPGMAEQWIKKGKQATYESRQWCSPFCANEARLKLSLIAYNLGNLWRRLALPNRINSWPLMSLEQRLGQTAERVIKHARHYSLLLADNLTRYVSGSMVSTRSALSSPAGEVDRRGEQISVKSGTKERKVSGQ